MKKLLLLILCALPLSAMQDPKKELLKQAKQENVNDYVKAGALGGFAGYTLTNIAVASVVGTTIIAPPVIVAGAGLGMGAQYLYNKYMKGN